MGSTIIFPHIPKCAGSSLRQQFLAAKMDVFLDYDKPPHLTSPFFQEECLRRNRECELLDFGNFDLVFGHFPIERYVRSTYRYVTLLRDPLERAVSHYNYWKNMPTTNLQAIYRNPIITDIQSGKVGFPEFVQQLRLGGFYSSYLGGKQPSEFVLVGFMDEYQDFAGKLSVLLNVEISADVHLRPGGVRACRDRKMQKGSWSLILISMKSLGVIGAKSPGRNNFHLGKTY